MPYFCAFGVGSAEGRRYEKLGGQPFCRIGLNCGPVEPNRR